MHTSCASGRTPTTPQMAWLASTMAQVEGAAGTPQMQWLEAMEEQAEADSKADEATAVETSNAGGVMNAGRNLRRNRDRRTASSASSSESGVPPSAVQAQLPGANEDGVSDGVCYL